MKLMPLKLGAKISPPLIDGLLGICHRQMRTHKDDHLRYWIYFFSQCIQAPTRLSHSGPLSSLFSQQWGGRCGASSPPNFHGTLELRSRCQEW